MFVKVDFRVEITAEPADEWGNMHKIFKWQKWLERGQFFRNTFFFFFQKIE